MCPAVEVTVLIPAFDEEKRIGRAVRESILLLEAEGARGEILVVDDGSGDATARIVEEVAASDPRVRLFRLPTNRGKGAAVRAGVFESRGEIVFVIDADLSTPLDTIGRALPHLRDGTDVVTGSRHCEGARVVERQGVVRRSLGKGFLAIARRVADPAATDITCGFKGFRRAAAVAIFRRTAIDGWAFDAETALIARRLNLVRREIPVEWTNDPDSRVRIRGAVLRSLRDLVRIGWRDARGAYDVSPEEREDARARGAP
jgi:dolichyl-phosphate beta-glucosyltransferase